MLMEVILENLVNIAGAAAITLLGVLGAVLTARLSKKTRLAAVNAAQQELIAMTQITVGELQQTLVEGLKAASKDGKLTKADVTALGLRLVQETMEKLSEPSRKLLEAAGVDIIALIRGAGEDWILRLKQGQ